MHRVLDPSHLDFETLCKFFSRETELPMSHPVQVLDCRCNTPPIIDHSLQQLLFAILDNLGEQFQGLGICPLCKHRYSKIQIREGLANQLKSFIENHRNIGNCKANWEETQQLIQTHLLELGSGLSQAGEKERENKINQISSEEMRQFIQCCFALKEQLESAPVSSESSSSSLSTIAYYTSSPESSSSPTATFDLPPKKPTKLRQEAFFTAIAREEETKEKTTEAKVEDPTDFPRMLEMGQALSNSSLPLSVKTQNEFGSLFYNPRFVLSPGTWGELKEKLENPSSQLSLEAWKKISSSLDQPELAVSEEAKREIKNALKPKCIEKLQAVFDRRDKARAEAKREVAEVAARRKPPQIGWKERLAKELQLLMLAFFTTQCILFFLRTSFGEE